MSLADDNDTLLTIIEAVHRWEKSFPYFEADDTLHVDKERFHEIAGELTERLKNNYPFHHPLYAGQMLKPPHAAAMMGYIAAMMINPNNHALDAGPATAQMEKELIELFAHKLGFDRHLGHLTSSGTIANFEALFIAREIHPSKLIIFSDQAHYTHKRVCHWLRLDCLEARSTPQGKMEIGHLEEILERNKVGTVVVTLGSTSLGTADELDRILDLQKKYHFRIHADGAYGGYFALISGYKRNLNVYDSISHCDSFVFDPHKQGLQPYGCGAVIFKDPEVGRFYKHDSPYTYFTSDELHLGEISIECSRAGAAAAALWLTVKLFELEYDRGMGPILKKTIDAAINLAASLRASQSFELYLEPESNIVTYFPKAATTASISELSEKIMISGMNSRDNQLYLATLKIKSRQFSSNHPDITVDSDNVTILRSCLMKPEHALWVPRIMENLEHLCAGSR
ncbi:MAG: pyridoxal phosphate-dependent decarboxylase family protein [Candidatus Xenobiia bacterium LiM19]